MEKMALAQCQLVVAGIILSKINITACELTVSLAEIATAEIYFQSSTSAYQQWLNETASINLDHTTVFEGIVTHVYKSEKTCPSTFKLTLRTRLITLTRKSHNRIFTKQTSKSIIQSLLENSGIGAVFHCNEKPIRFPLFTQYKQTDFDCLKQISQLTGGWFYEDKNKMIIADHHTPQKPTPLTYLKQGGLNSNSACVFKITHKKQLLSNSISGLDYNPETAQLTLKNTRKCTSPSTGEWLYFANHAQSAHRQRQQLAYLQHAPAAALRISSNYPNLKVGQSICIQQHPLLKANNLYHIIAINHHWEMYYSNHCLLYPSTQIFRQAPAKRRYFGLQSAVISAKQANTPTLDTLGRYQIQMPYQDKPIDAPLIRHMVQLTGPNFGQHFPLHEKTEVALAYVNGDINSPIILGSLTNTKNKDIVTHNNATEHLIKTRSEQTLCFDDNKKNPTLLIKNKQHALTFSRKPAKLSLSNTNGNVQITTEKNFFQACGHSYQQNTLGSAFTAIKQQYHLHASTLQLNSETNSLQMRAEKNININSKTTLKKTTQHYRLQTQQLTLNTEQYDEQGAKQHKTSAQSIQMNTGDAFKLVCGNSEILFDKKGNISLSSKQINLHCKHLKNLAKKTLFDPENT